MKLELKKYFFRKSNRIIPKFMASFKNETSCSTQQSLMILNPTHERNVEVSRLVWNLIHRTFRQSRVIKICKNVFKIAAIKLNSNLNCSAGLYVDLPTRRLEILNFIARSTLSIILLLKNWRKKGNWAEILGAGKDDRNAI